MEAQSEINLSFKSIRGQGRHPPAHEEITRSTNDRNVPTLIHQRIRAGQIYGTPMLRRVEHQGEP